MLKIKCVTKIQEFWIRRIQIKKFKEKIIAKKRAEAKGEYFDLELESFEDFSHNNYKLENQLRKIEIQNNKSDLTKKLKKEKDPKKIVQILLYGGEGKNKLTRAQKYGIDLTIEDKLIRQGEIMKKTKKDLADKYQKKFYENNQFKPKIPKNTKEIMGNKYPGEFLKRLEFYKLFKEKNLEELKKNKDLKKKIENKKGDLYSDKTNETKKKNYEYFVKNAFDRLHNEQIQIEQNKRRASQLENSKMFLFNDLYINVNNEKNNKNALNNANNENKKDKKRMTLKELLLSDNVKKMYRNSLVSINLKNEIWPQKLKSNYISKEINKINEENQSFESKESLSNIENNDSN